MTEGASGPHSHRYLWEHKGEWLCSCGKRMDESDTTQNAERSTP